MQYDAFPLSRKISAIPGHFWDSKHARLIDSLVKTPRYRLQSTLLCLGILQAHLAVMAEVTISPSMPGENTKHSPMQEGAVPAIGHLNGSDPAPTSAGNVCACIECCSLVNLITRCAACSNLARFACATSPWLLAGFKIPRRVSAIRSVHIRHLIQPILTFFLRCYRCRHALGPCTWSSHCTPRYRHESQGGEGKRCQPF